MVVRIDLALAAHGWLLITRLVRPSGARHALRCWILIVVKHACPAGRARGNVSHGRQVCAVLAAIADSIQQWRWLLNHILPSGAHVPTVANFAVAKISNPALTSVTSKSSVRACRSCEMGTVVSAGDTWIGQVAEPPSKGTIRCTRVSAHLDVPEIACVVTNIGSDARTQRPGVRQSQASCACVGLATNASP